MGVEWRAKRQRVQATALAAALLEADAWEAQTALFVGLCGGNDLAAIREAFDADPSRQWWGVDPLRPTNLEAMQLDRYERVLAWDSSGQVPFRVDPAIDCSSAATRGPKPATTTVQAELLDELFGKQALAAGPLLIVLDCEGGELRALKGAEQQVLPNCRWLVVELTYRPKYRTWPDAHQVINWLAARNWWLLTEIGRLNKGVTDAIFVRN